MRKITKLIVERLERHGNFQNIKEKLNRGQQIWRKMYDDLQLSLNESEPPWPWPARAGLHISMEDKALVGTAVKHKRSLEFTHVLEILNSEWEGCPSWMWGLLQVLPALKFWQGLRLFVCLFVFILKSLFISCKLTAFCNTFHNKNMLENLNIKPNRTL